MYMSEIDVRTLATAELYCSLDPITVPPSSPQATFINWGLSFTCRPLAVFEPENEAQCRAILELARRENVPVRAAGAGHSPSDQACTQGFMIRTGKMNKLLEVDQSAGLVTVQGGMILHVLHVHLAAHNLGLTSVGSISDQSIAGVVTTATHGSGLTYPSMSCLVQSLTLLLSDGSIVKTSRNPSEDPDLFLATLCGLGSTGIIMTVTLQCEKRFRLREEAENVDFGDFVRRFADIAASAEHVRCWWFGQRGVVRVSRCNRTNEPPRKGASWFRQVFLAYHVVQFTLFLGRYWPRWNTWTARFASWLMKEKSVGVDDSWKIFNVDCRYPQHTTEYGLPMANVPACLLALQEFTQRELSDPKGLRPHFPFEIRFSEADDIWLSPAYSRRTCWIGVAQYKPYGLQVPYTRLLSHVSHILYSHGGRPHWAKEHPFGPADFQQMYSMWGRFNEVRRRVDSIGMWASEWSRRCFGVAGEDSGGKLGAGGTVVDLGEGKEARLMSQSWNVYRVQGDVM